MTKSLSVFKKDFFKIAKWAAIVLGIIIGIILIIRLFFFVKEIFFPSPPTPATVSFGKIPPIKFQNGIQKEYKYTLDTLSGTTPILPDKIEVFEMGDAEPDILAVERAREKVQNIGFTNPPEQLSDVVYRWQTNEPFLKTLIMNVHLPQVNLTSAFLTNQNILSAVYLPDQKTAITAASNFLNTLSLKSDDLDDEKTETKLLSIENGVIKEASSISNAELIGVYFKNKNVNEMPIFYPRGVLSNIGVIVGSGEFSSTDPQIVDARYFHQPITDKSATYPIKTAEEALEELKNGKAYIASYDGVSDNILIKDIYLGYYIEGETQKYLMPIIVLEGSDGFLAYVSGVRDEWIDK
jgi:hypothetical protein